MEATNVAGLGNEVGGVAISNTTDTNKSHIQYGSVEVNRFGVTSISHTMEGRGRRRKVKEGFSNEIKNVKASSTQGDLWIHSAWYRELARFGVGMAKLLKGLWHLLMGGMRGRTGRPAEAGTITPRERQLVDASDDSDQPDIYEQFLRGDTFSICPTTTRILNLRENHEMVQLVVRLQQLPKTTTETETVSLYTDLSSVPSTSAPLLLAHMTDTSTSPLTRRRYSRLVSGADNRSPERESMYDDWSKLVDDRKFMFGPVDEAEELSAARRNCVICTVEPRQIDLLALSVSNLLSSSFVWSAHQCLSPCLDVLHSVMIVRENLATRSSASKHTCPCCRRKYVLRNLGEWTVLTFNGILSAWRATPKYLFLRSQCTRVCILVYQQLIIAKHATWSSCTRYVRYSRYEYYNIMDSRK